MRPPFEIGQRWISESEPELGLGSVLQIAARTVIISFPATGETRQYSLESAPLRRVRFHAGDTIKARDGSKCLVDSVHEQDGLIVYRCERQEIPETELDGQISFNSPQDRLRQERVDPSDVFDLRLAALQHQHRRRQSEARGFVGARIELIPHQLSIAPEVSGRLIPRVLLADEVGLGKTIEACLIVHRLIQTGRARRVLVLVPEPLVHQWFVELLRRFNLWFHVFDEERCESIEVADPAVNPFLDDQLVLCGIGFLAQDAKRAGQAGAAGWDMLVVDEAHHLGWAPDAVSPEYALVETLAGKTAGLLLLTATPEQFGIASHFARLRLLDPERYYDLQAFLREAEHYREVADIAQNLLNRRELTSGQIPVLARILRREAAVVAAQIASIQAGDERARTELIDDLVDQHGTGRVMFRNTRAVIAGFPKRTPRLCALAPAAESAGLLEQLAQEFASDNSRASSSDFKPDLEQDPRVAWLATLLRELKDEKVLLICHSPQKVLALEEALRRRLQIKTALFHEGLPLVQRDRNAAWFAEDDGARILLASEIGSEGRNFQFAHHLVLFDLPLDPELLEQRIGRLDRIGQASEIFVHVPYVAGSSFEVLARWHHEGLNAFAENLRGGHALLEQFGARVLDLAQDFHETHAAPELDALLRETRAAAREVTERLEHGRDRLLELNSFRPEAAARIIQLIRQADQDAALEEFMLSVFDHFNIQTEELAPRTYRLGSAGVFADAFPGLPADGMTVTLDRQRALSREDIQFLSWDHPLATSALDLILGAATGNSSFALWPDSQSRGVYLEAVFLLECVAPPHLHIDRFLPPTPIRVLVDHRGQDAAGPGTQAGLRQLRTARPSLLDAPGFRDELLPALLRNAEQLANSRAPGLISHARKRMTTQLDHEIHRLRELHTINPNVSRQEIDLLIAHQRALDDHLSTARIRLDSVRLIQRGPVAR